MTGTANVSSLKLVERERRYLVGRSKTCDLYLKVDELSREHASFTRGWNGVVVRDLGSKNGILVNGHPHQGAAPRRRRPDPDGPAQAASDGSRGPLPARPGGQPGPPAGRRAPIGPGPTVIGAGTRTRTAAGCRAHPGGRRPRARPPSRAWPPHVTPAGAAPTPETAPRRLDEMHPAIATRRSALVAAAASRRAATDPSPAHRDVRGRLRAGDHRRGRGLPDIRRRTERLLAALARSARVRLPEKTDSRTPRLRRGATNG